MQKELPGIDVTPEQWRIIQDILQTCIPELEVWAFGSRATGTAKPYSDLDLAIITREPLTLAKSADISEAFTESDLPWKVDLVDWATTSDTFREIIQNQRVVIQEPEA